MSSYVTQLILKYAHKYIRGIEANLKLSLWGGDVVLNNLDLRLDVIQKELGIPLNFRLSRGFVKELRIHIPWTALTTKSIEVTLTDVECVLRYDRHPSPEPVVPDEISTPTAAAIQPGKGDVEPADADGGGFWAQDLLVKVVSNLYVRVNNFVFIYEEEDICATLTMHSASLMSVNASWMPQFVNLEGPWKLLRKKLMVEKVRLYLGKLDRWSRQRNEAESIVKDFSAEVRVATYTSLKMPSGFELCEAAVDQPSGPAVTVDVFCQPLHLSIDSHQLQLLSRMLANKQSSAKAPPIPKAAKTEHKTDVAIDLPPPKKKEEKRTWMSWAWDMVVDDQEGTFEAERTLQIKLLPFAPPDLFVFCLHVTEISLSLANAGMSALPKSRPESLSLTPERKIDSPGSLSWSRPHAVPPSVRFAVIYLEQLIVSVEKLQNSSSPPAFVFDLQRISCVDHTSSGQHSVFVCGTETSVRKAFPFLNVNPGLPLARKHPFQKLPFLHTVVDQETSESELSRWQQGGSAISIFHSVSPHVPPILPSSGSLPSSSSASASFRVASSISASLCSSSTPSTPSKLRETESGYLVSTDIAIGSLAFVMDCSNGIEGKLVSELSRFLSFKRADEPPPSPFAGAPDSSAPPATPLIQQTFLFKFQLNHVLGLVKVSEFANWRLTAAVRDMNCVEFELMGLRVCNGWSQLDSEVQKEVDGVSIQDVSVRLASVHRKLDKWSASAKVMGKKQDERLLLRLMHLALELRAPSKFAAEGPVLSLFSLLFGKLNQQASAPESSSGRNASLSLYLASISSSISPQQFAFVLSVAGAVCEIFSPNLQRLLTSSRLVQTGRSDKRVADWILDVSLHRIAISLTLSPGYSTGGVTKCVLAGSLGYGEATVQREAVRRLLFVGPFLDRDPTSPLFDFTLSSSDEMLAWLLSVVNLAKPPRDTKQLLSAGANRLVLQLASAALLWDSVWLEVCDLFIDLNSAMYETMTRPTRASSSSSSSSSSFASSSSSSSSSSSEPSTASFTSSSSSSQPHSSVHETFSSSEILHLLAVSFCNVFEVYCVCNPLFLCFPFNDQFHLKRHRLHWKFKGVTPIVIQFPKIALSLAQKDERTPSSSNHLVGMDLAIQGLHLFSHHHHVSVSDPSIPALPYFESYFAKPKRNCDMIAPWSVEISTQWLPHSPTQAAPWACGVFTTIKADCLSMALTHQQTLAVCLVLDTLRLAHHDTTSSIRSSSFAKSRPPDASNYRKHRSPFALFAVNQPPDFVKAVPGLYHLRVAMSAVTHLHPTCATPETVPTSDFIKFEIGCVLIEAKLDESLNFTNALISISMPHVRFVPWPTPEIVHPGNELFFCKGLYASLDRAPLPSGGLFYQIRAYVQPLTGVCNLPVILQTYQMILDIVPPPPLAAPAAEFSPLRQRTSIPSLVLDRKPVVSPACYEVWVCVQVESLRFLFPCSSSPEDCVCIGMERVWLHSPMAATNAECFPLICEILNNANTLVHSCQLCDSLRSRSPSARSEGVFRPPSEQSIGLDGAIHQFCIHTGSWASSSAHIVKIPFSNPVDLYLSFCFHPPREATGSFGLPSLSSVNSTSFARRRSSSSTSSLSSSSSSFGDAPLKVHVPLDTEEIAILPPVARQAPDSLNTLASKQNRMEIQVRVTPIVLRISPQSLRSLRALAVSLLHTQRAFGALGTQSVSVDNSAHSSPRTSTTDDTMTPFRLETTVSLSSVILDICGESTLLEQQLRVIVSAISFRHDHSQQSLALATQLQGALSIGNLEVIFVKPRQISLLSWQQLHSKSNNQNNTPLPPCFISGTWTLFAMDWEVLPFHLKLPFDVIQFLSDVASAALSPTDSPMGPPSNQPPRECHRTMRTMKVVLHGSTIGLYSAPPLESVILLKFESAFVLQSATQTECFFRHAIIWDPLQIRVVGFSIRIASLKQEEGSLLLHPATWTLECISRAKVNQDAPEELTLAGTLIAFHQEMRVSVGFESVECRWETGYIRIVLEMLTQFNTLFRPAATVPVLTQPSLASSSDIIGVPFLRMSLGDTTGRKFFQDDFRSMSIDDLFGKRPRSAHVTFSSADEERSMCWKYPSPRSVTHVAHAALLSLEGARSRGELKCDCKLSAWDWLTEQYVLVSQFMIDLHTPNTAVLETTAVAREWKLSWSPFDPKAGIPSASELGQLVRVDSSYDVVSDLLLSVTLPALQIRLVDSCHAEQLMLLRIQQLSFSSRFWLNPGYHSPNSKALSFAVHRLRCGSLSMEMIQYRDLLRCPLLTPVALEALIALNPHPFKAGGTPSLDAGGWAFSASMGATHFTVGKTAICVLKHAIECVQAHQLPARTSTPFSKGSQRVPVAEHPQHACAHYILRNSCGMDLQFGQVGTPESKPLCSSQELTYSWYSLAPSLSFPLSAPPFMSHPFFCPEPQFSTPQVGDSQHHWLRISADSLSGWSQPFVIDILPEQSSRTIADLRKRIALEGRRGSFRPVRVYRTQPSETPQDDSVPPFISLVSVIFVQVEQFLHTTIITFCASHTFTNYLPRSLSLCFVKCPRPHLALLEPKIFRQIEYAEAQVVEPTPEGETRILEPGATTLLPVWFSRQLPSPKPISLASEVLRVLGGLQTGEEMHWLDVFEIPLDGPDASQLPGHKLCNWGFPPVRGWCFSSSLEARSPRLVAFRPVVMFSHSIPSSLSVACHSANSDVKNEILVPEHGKTSVLNPDPQNAWELTCALQDVSRATFVTSIDLNADVRELVLSAQGAENTARLSIQQEAQTPTLLLRLFSVFAVSNHCGRRIVIHSEPPNSLQQVVPRTSGEANRIEVPGKAHNVPLFWPQRDTHRFWIGLQCYKTDTMFWSQTFVLDKDGEMTYGLRDPKPKAKKVQSNKPIPRQDQEFDILTIDGDNGIDLFQLVLSAEHTNSNSNEVLFTLQPRFWLHNRSKQNLLLQVCMRSEGPMMLGQGQVSALEGLNVAGQPQYDAKAPRNFRPALRAMVSGWGWSQEFSLADDPSPHFLRMHHQSLGFDRLQAYAMLVHHKVRHLIFIDKQPPCILINSTSLELSYWVRPVDADSKAHEASGLQSSVSPGQSTELEVNLPEHVPLNAEVSSSTAEKRPIDANQLQIRLAHSTMWCAPFFLLPGKHKLTVSSDHALTTPSMTLLDLDISFWRGSLVVLVQRLVGGVPVALTALPAMEKIMAPNFQFSLRAPLLSVSVIDEDKAVSCATSVETALRSTNPSKPSLCLWPNGQEVMRVEVRDVHMQVSSGPKPAAQSPVWDASSLAVGLQVGYLQVDNQLSQGEFPVVASCDQVDSKQSAMEFEAQWRLPSELFFRNPYFPTFDSPDLDFVHIAMSPITLNVEDSFVFRTADLALALALNVGAFQETEKASPEESKGDETPGEEQSESKNFGRVALFNDAAMIAKFGAEMVVAMKHIEAPDFSFHQLRISEVLFRVTVHSSLAASVFLGVERMPVHLSAVSLKSTCCSPDRLVREISGGYLADVLVRTPVLLGSLSLLGNPTFLVESLGRGLQDLVNMPKDALSQGPSAFVRAMLGGVVSLLQHVTHGTLTSVSGFSNGLARNVEQLSPEDRFSLQREMMRTRPPEDLGRGLLNGFSTLGQSVAGAFLGVLASPIEGAARGGAWGFVKGVSGGLIGVVTKPVTGMLDLVSQTSQGLAGSSRSDVHSRQRRALRSQVPISELGLWFSALKFEALAKRYGEGCMDHLFCCDVAECQTLHLLLRTDRGLRVFAADILILFVPFCDLSVISGPARSARVSLDVLCALRESTQEMKEEESLDFFVVENGAKPKLEYLVIAQAGRSFLGGLRGNSHYQGKQGRLEEKRS